MSAFSFCRVACCTGWSLEVMSNSCRPKALAFSKIRNLKSDLALFLNPGTMGGSAGFN